MDIVSGDKFQYLFQATIPIIRARELVESFPPNTENYQNVIVSLKSRFGMNLCTLYDKIDTQLRTFETFGVTSKYFETMLFPLTESCLLEDLLRVWQRSDNFSNRGSSSSSLSDPTEIRLKYLMLFQKRSNVEKFARV